MNEYLKEITKRYEKIGKLKSDIGVMPRWFTSIVYVFIIIAVAGLLMSFLGMMEYAVWVSVGCLLVVIILYFTASRRGPVRYTEVMLKSRGKYLLFQIINEKNVIFTDGEYTLEYKNKQVKERAEGILHPELSYDAPLRAEYGSSTVKGNYTYYVGEYTDNNKKYTYKVQLSHKFLAGFSMNGRKVMFDCINDKSAGLGIPAALAEEILKRGTVLPKNDVFLSKR